MNTTSQSIAHAALAGSIACGALAVPPDYVLVADSVSDFGGAQRGGNWLYLFDAGTGEPPRSMNYFIPNGYSGDIWSATPGRFGGQSGSYGFIGAGFVHPSWSTGCGPGGIVRPILRWQPCEPGEFHVEVRGRSEACTGGVRIDLMVDGATVASANSATGSLDMAIDQASVASTDISVRVDSIGSCYCDFVSNFSVRIWRAPCVGDLNGDGAVNGSDLGGLLAFWGPNPVFAGADIDLNGIVNGADLGMLLANWGSCNDCIE